MKPEIDEQTIERLKNMVQREVKLYVDKLTYPIEQQVDNIKSYLKDLMRRQIIPFADLNNFSQTASP